MCKQVIAVVAIGICCTVANAQAVGVLVKLGTEAAMTQIQKAERAAGTQHYDLSPAPKEHGSFSSNVSADCSLSSRREPR